MSLKTFFIKQVAHIVKSNVYKAQEKAVDIQHSILIKNIKSAHKTKFGTDHNFEKIKNYEDFKQYVEVRDYEENRQYFDKVKAGKSDILWKGKPVYFAKTSGTTSGAKYIPITKESINHHIIAARNALLLYVSETKNADFFSRKMIFLQGSPALTQTNGIKTGRLSGIVYHHVPKWLLNNRKPSYVTNCIEDWERKVETIVEETINEDMSVVGGIPPWCIMYFEQLLEKSSKVTVSDLFKNFKLFVYGGVNYEPYRKKIEDLIGNSIDTIETYPASEGFFAYQDIQSNKGLLLNIDAGIFFEFIKVSEVGSANPNRISLAAIELDTNYLLIVSTNAGLWAYNTGDTVKFISKNPYRILVTGRIKHFISSFGEHVIAEEVEFAMSESAKQLNLTIVEFTVAPYIAKNENEKSYHEWLIETTQQDLGNETINKLSSIIDSIIQQKNMYYKDLRAGNILSKPKITILKPNTFYNYQVKNEKLGGQNKVQHLANDRKLAEELLDFSGNI